MNFLSTVFAAIIALLQACFGVRPYEVPAGTDIFAVAEGTWDWAGQPGTCRDNPHRISFSPDRRQMVLSYRVPFDSVTGKQVSTYDILLVTRHGIRGSIVDETRRTPDGDLVVWDLVLTSPTTYRWHRTDWPAAGYTPELIRCDAPVSVITQEETV